MLSGLVLEGQASGGPRLPSDEVMIKDLGLKPQANPAILPRST